MTFLNPLVLLAMAAAGIPLLLHLLNLRKLRTVEFSSLRFLKELQKTRIRRLKLRQILLLILRMLLVAFAVLAFARPALRGSAGLPGSHAATTAVILVDNSLSMTVRDEQGERFKQAKQAAQDIVGLLEESDEAYLMPMTDLAHGAEAEPSRNHEVLRTSIADMKLGYRRADLDDGLRVAATLLDKSENLNKEVYIITDAQRANVSGRIDSLRIFGAGTRVYLLPIGIGSDVARANLGLDSIRVLSTIFEQNKPVEVRAWVHNYGQEDVQNAMVNLHIGGERLAQTSVTVGAGATEVVDLSAPLKHPGLQSGHVEIEGDALEADNRRYFAFPVLDKMQIALVGSPASTEYLRLALDISPGAIQVQTVTPNALPALDLSKYSTVVLAEANPGDASRLAQYVEDGGGVVIYGGPAVNENTFNATIGAALGISVAAPVGDANNRERTMTFASVEREHPIFAGVFDPANPGNLVESPAVRQVMPATGGETIIRLTNGLPFMSEYRRGRGRAIYIGVPPTAAWSDFPMKGIFVPVAARTALYVGARGEEFAATTVSEQITVQLPPRRDLPEQVKVTAPDGHEEFVAVRRLPSGSTIIYDNTNVPGVYRVTAGAQDIALFTANMGSGESDLTPIDEDHLREAIAARMVTPDNLTILESSGGDFAEAITASRFGLELWKYMLALAIICAFTEMIVGRAPKTAEAAA
jgi:hypothetical protein